MRLLFLGLALAMVPTVELNGDDAIPLVYGTDLYHPHEDPDDHLDLATVFAMPELDIKLILLDEGARQRRQPGAIPVEQMLRLTGRRLPYAVGLTPLASPRDDGRGQPAEFQSGVERLIEVLRSAKAPVRIVTAGSVRDVQAAFNREPALLREKVEGVYINIGNSTVGGEEYNVQIDRHAFVGLMRSGLPIRWFPCFPATGAETTYFRFHHFPDALRAMPGGWRNFFLYALRRLEPTKFAPLPSLTADLGSPDVALAGSAAFRGGKEMWCTPSLFLAAGRGIYRVGDRYIARRGCPPGGVDVTPYELRPVHIRLDDRGVLTSIEPGPPDSPIRVIHLKDPGLYAAAMDEVLFELLAHAGQR